MASQRGIDPETLLSHVNNTAPFLFTTREPLTPYTKVVLDAREKKNFSHEEYFTLCLCAHYTTVATFVPTDVDNQIRKSLWIHKLSSTEKMAAIAMESLAWDYRPVTARYQECEGLYLSGHQGEWFSVAVGAYASHLKNKKEISDNFFDKISKELEQEAKIFAELKKKKDGIGLLKASTIIAHNLGDLDRVIDQWEIPEENPLRKKVYKLGHKANENFGSLQEFLLEAGALNKEYMASENHRHYPLRKAKCLRKSLDYILPIGPFFDEWGFKISQKLAPHELADVTIALLDGFSRLSSPKVPLYGYARAIGGILKGFPSLSNHLPEKAAKQINSIPIAKIYQNRDFTAHWSKKALNFLKLI